MFALLASFLLWLFATGKYSDWASLIDGTFGTSNSGRRGTTGASGDW